MTEKKQKLDDIAQGIAEVTEELMHDSVAWQLEDFPQDGDEYEELHEQVLNMAIKKLYESSLKYKTYPNPNPYK